MINRAHAIWSALILGCLINGCANKPSLLSAPAVIIAEPDFSNGEAATEQQDRSNRALEQRAPVSTEAASVPRRTVVKTPQTSTNSSSGNPQPIPPVAKNNRSEALDRGQSSQSLPSTQRQNSSSASPPEKAAVATNVQQRSNSQPEQQTQKYIQPPLPLRVTRIRQSGKLHNKELTEVSGFAASRATPGVLYAINDSGHTPSLYALSETGEHLAKWSIEGRNRDWEDLASVTINGQHFLVIAETGDNLQIHKTSRLLILAEPLFSMPEGSILKPAMTISFVYEDGPRNVEAIAIQDRRVLLISKEPPRSTGSVRSRLYELDLPGSSAGKVLTARFITTLPKAPASLESRLAATFAGVDLDHITAVDIDRDGTTAFLLTYREVRQIERSANQTWSEALQSRGRRLHFHQLGQSEALAVTGGGTVFITSENNSAAIWAIPAQ